MTHRNSPLTPEGQRITPYTPRHSGKIERYNRILAEEFRHARTLATQRRNARTL